MRAAFHADYYARHSRPLADRLTLLAERYSPYVLTVASLLGPYWPVTARIGEWLTGTVHLPAWLAKRPPRELRLTADDLTAGNLPDRTVILVQDWFTALFDSEVLVDSVAGLRALGYFPRVLDLHPAGKAAQSLGDRKHFKSMGQALIAQINKASASGAPIIGLDPAFVMMLRQDYPKEGLHPPQVLLPQEFLAYEIDTGKCFPKAENAHSIRLLSHCTEASVLPNTRALWSKIFSAIGLQLETPATGCCGMAGLFGHQKRHQTVSRKLFEMSWRERMEGEIPLAVTGFSCRCQTLRLAGKVPRHPLGLIADLVASTRGTGRNSQPIG